MPYDVYAYGLRLRKLNLHTYSEVRGDKLDIYKFIPHQQDEL